MSAPHSDCASDPLLERAWAVLDSMLAADSDCRMAQPIGFPSAQRSDPMSDMLDSHSEPLSDCAMERLSDSSTEHLSASPSDSEWDLTGSRLEIPWDFVRVNVSDLWSEQSTGSEKASSTVLASVRMSELLRAQAKGFSKEIT